MVEQRNDGFYADTPTFTFVMRNLLHYIDAYVTYQRDKSSPSPLSPSLFPHGCIVFSCTLESSANASYKPVIIYHVRLNLLLSKVDYVMLCSYMNGI